MTIVYVIIYPYLLLSDDDGSTCDRNMFRCENGPCIQGELRCNGNIDCPFDTSDELDCRKSTRFWMKKEFA